MLIYFSSYHRLAYFYNNWSRLALPIIFFKLGLFIEEYGECLDQISWQIITTNCSVVGYQILEDKKYPYQTRPIMKIQLNWNSWKPQLATKRAFISIRQNLMNRESDLQCVNFGLSQSESNISVVQWNFGNPDRWKK